MSTFRFLLNQTLVSEQASADTPLLDVIRRNRHLTGCKEGCREGDCGACLVLLGKFEHDRLVYRPATSCLLALGAVSDQHIVTIEGLSNGTPNPIQQALIEQGGIQCGFCTPGIVIALTAFFLNSASSDIDAAIDAVAGNLCRCTGYAGIKRAIGQLCAQFDLAQSPLENRLNDCLRWKLLPAYFASIGEQLVALSIPAPSPLREKVGMRGNETINFPHPKSPFISERDFMAIAGGTDWMVHHDNSINDPNLQFLPKLPDQDCIRLNGQHCQIAASTTIEQLRISPILQKLLPAISNDLKLLCSAPVRQHASLGGNLANASPIADLAVFFLALDAELTLEKHGQQRNVPLHEFFLAYKQTALQSSEQIVEICFDIGVAASGFSFEKVSKRIHLDIASVNAAMSIRLSGEEIADAHVAAGGVAPIPLYLAATRDYLCGKPLKPETILAAAAIAQTEIAPISDLRGSSEYKRLLFRQLFFSHFLKLFPEQIRWEALHALG